MHIAPLPDPNEKFTKSYRRGASNSMREAAE